MQSAPSPVRSILLLSIPAVLFLALMSIPRSQQAGETGRTYVTGSVFLEIDLGGKKTSGFVKSLKGGNLAAEVITEKAGPGQPVGKHLGAPRYEALVFQFQPYQFPEILPALLAGQEVSGSIYTLDFDKKPQTQRQFSGAFFTRFDLPVLDGSTKDASYITVQLVPRQVQAVAQPAAPPAGTKEQKKTFVSANFRVTIPGLDTTKVNKVEGISIQRKVVEDTIGEKREFQKQPAALEFPNVKVTMANSHIKTWMDWVEDFVGKGNNGPDKERSLLVELLSPDLKEVLYSLEARGVGIMALRSQVEENADAIARSEAELYVEGWKMVTGTAPAGVAPVPPAGVPSGLRRPKG